MCGIFALLNNENTFSETLVENEFYRGQSRGPEHSILTKVGIRIQFGFHRLAINGLNNFSNQPIEIDNIILICNGEIYNYKQLYNAMNIEPYTDSDCEVIIHLYKKYGMQHTLQMLDGVFAFVLLDQRIEHENSKIFVARDPYGIRPLCILENNRDGSEDVIGFASEMKSLIGFTKKTTMKVYNFKPGTCSIYTLSSKVSSYWKLLRRNIPYHHTTFSTTIVNENISIEEVLRNIRLYLKDAVKKRCMNTERPIACLLSGGLDSSLITALVCEYRRQNNLPPVETYSIGLEGSEDLKYARMVAQHLETNHHEILLTEQDFTNAIPEVIYAIESYDTTSVRASIGNYLLGKYISQHSEAKVIFNGDGSDELTGGYLYMHHAPDDIEFDKECRRLLSQIYTFDVLRSDKCISSHGLEPRTPFLDRMWTQYYLSIPPQIRNHNSFGHCEKFLLRMAFQNELLFPGKSLLPKEVIWRRKEAFSDGVSDKTRSLFEILQEHAQNIMNSDIEKYLSLKITHHPEVTNLFEKMCYIDPEMAGVSGHNTPKTVEQYYYRKVFEFHYFRNGHVIPYFWMPKYVEASDASARTLQIYNNEKKTTG
jgi:asparagine synthase (glutamine-hydrolysing)